jgi:2-polyprenyl-3-methyl-5-hydroxy-6-metoxy-1,4-benzoquinol methylase
MQSNTLKEYAFGHSSRELDRLQRQAKLLEPFTRQLLLEAGLTNGMRVLDVGSGAGDVAMLISTIVGSTGQVIGVDRSAVAIAVAKKRAELANLSNIQYLEGDPVELDFGESFDAVVGRHVLMYYPRPADVLRKLTFYVKSGGLVIFQEPDFDAGHSLPPVPLYEQGRAWIGRALRAAGADPQIGLKLLPIYVSAGLPAPQMRYDTTLGGGADWHGCTVGVETLRSLLPVIEKFGIADAKEIDIDTFEDRYRSQLADCRSVVVNPPVVGAWCRVPEAQS